MEGESEEEGKPRRRGKGRYVLLAVAAIAVLLSLLNASWLAPRPPGRLIVVANRGIAVPFDHQGLKDDDCTATRIRPPGDNPYIENTLPSLYRAMKTGADAVAVQVQPTRDGNMVVFHDWSLDCRTNGHGAVREHSLAELKKLDVGYGYTADGGRTFPFRGKGIGGMPTVEELLRELPASRIIFVFKSKDPGDADALVAAFRRAGVEIDDTRLPLDGLPAEDRLPDEGRPAAEGAGDPRALGGDGPLPAAARRRARGARSSSSTTARPTPMATSTSATR
jgi:glycerophosphoryl diester phosphodiesterase